MLPTMFGVNWLLGLGEEAENRFSRWHGGYLGFPIGTILAIFDLQVTPMLPSKFGINWPFGSGEEAKNRFSRWRPWRPSWISDRHDFSYFDLQKMVREKSRECHNHKPQPFPDPKRKRKPTNPNKHKPNKRTKSTKINSLFPKRGNRSTKRTEKHKNKITHGKTYNKSPRRINHKATKSKTTGTTALERSVEQTTRGFKALLQLANFTLGPDSVRIKAPNSVNASKRKYKNQINHYNKQRRVLMANSTVCQSKWKPIVEPRRAKSKTYRQARTHWLKFYEETVIESEARTAVVQLKSEA